MRKYVLPFSISFIFFFLLYVAMKEDEKFKPEFKYRIRTEHQLFQTNSYTKLSNGCIKFLQKEQDSTTVCGNYTIVEQKINNQ